MKYQYVVIGAGAAGLVVSIGLAKAKKNVLLIEKNAFGGDCTNFGCIPSKTLIASGKIAHFIKTAKDFGINLKTDDFDATGALERVRDVIKEIRSKEDENALKNLGVDTLKAKASFKSDKILKVEFANGQTDIIEAKKIIIATGSTAVIPPIEGLEDTPFDTNETIFDLKTLPDSLIIIGAGPIGSELGQAYQRLGTKVTIIDIAKRILSNEDSDASQLMQKIFEKEKIELYLDTTINSVQYNNNAFELSLTTQDNEKKINATKLLVATSRKPSFKDLNLENAHIKYTKKGILIDHFARTSKKHIFAIGDITGAPYFTHKAEAMARSVLMSLLVPVINKKISKDPLPRVTFTDPEVASIGLSEAQAIKSHGENQIATYIVPFEDLDRATTENAQDGFVKIVTHKWNAKLFGATIVGARAGEMLSEILIIMNKHIRLFRLTNIIHPYPTFSGAVKKAADKYFTETLLKRKK